MSSCDNIYYMTSSPLEIHQQKRKLQDRIHREHHLRTTMKRFKKSRLENASMSTVEVYADPFLTNDNTSRKCNSFNSYSTTELCKRRRRKQTIIFSDKTNEISRQIKKSSNCCVKNVHKSLRQDGGDCCRCNKPVKDQIYIYKKTKKYMTVIVNGVKHTSF